MASGYCQDPFCPLFAQPHPHATIQKAKHFDSDKSELQYIIAMEGWEEVAKVGSFGAKKYGQWNYKAGMPWMKLGGSLSRHLRSWLMGEDLDKESGLSHLAHLIYDALMLLDYGRRHHELDDRYTEDTNTDNLPY
jgi:hypothetical protein